MTLEDIKRAAYEDSKSSWAEMSAQDKLLFYEARDLYRDYRNGLISQDKCADSMRKYLVEYGNNCDEIVRGKAAEMRIGKLFQKIEITASEFRKNPDNFKAWNFMNDIYGVYSEMKGADKNQG